MRIAAIADLHCTKNSAGTFQPLVAALPERADVLVLCGDLTDYGLPEEARVLAKELTSVRIPILGVLGNHDVEAGKAEEIVAILRDAGVDVLDGDAREIAGVGFVGVKGFAGGFGSHALGPWGEETIKRFVHEALDEALKLETALARLRTAQRVALLHYSPIRATVEGEPLEILAFLGSSRLEEPLSRYPVDAVFHGHAHRGQLEGRTSGDVPVYNVAMPLLTAHFPGQPPIRFTEIPVSPLAKEVSHDSLPGKSLAPLAT
jgi:Icc-related predicted phosphoesterase